jgi:hypothetical protein
MDNKKAEKMPQLSAADGIRPSQFLSIIENL